MKKADTLIQNQIESKTINFHSTFVDSRRIKVSDMNTLVDSL